MVPIEPDLANDSPIIETILAGSGEGYLAADAVCPACDGRGLIIRPMRRGKRQHVQARCRACGNVLEC